MKFFKKLIRKIFALPTVIEGDYVAKLVDVKVENLKQRRVQKITFKYLLYAVETGEKTVYKETFINDISLLRCRALLWFLESFAVEFYELSDLIGAVFDITIEYDNICGKELPTILYRDVAALPPNLLD